MRDRPEASMVSPHRYSSHALILLAMLFVTGCFAAASVMSLADETADYPFRTRPTELLKSLGRLGNAPAGKAPSGIGSLPPDVMRLLERTNRGEVLTDRELIDAFLIASGVFDREGRDRYARRLDELTAAARRAIASLKTPSERSDALLKFLHNGPMKGGYDAEQTRLSVLLDTGKFNCVSATALFQIVARRLQLNSQAVSIPGGVLAGHAMSNFRDGDRRIDVETTNPEGFDFQNKVKESGATVIGVQLDPALGHDVSEVGLASLIAQNLASGGGKRKDHLAAIQAALVGLALDPFENAKANNFLAAVNDRAMQLGDAKKYEEALAVMQFGLELLPSDDKLTNNAGLLWNQYATFQARASRAADAVAIVRRAVKAGQFKQTNEAEAAPFVTVADELADAKKWPEAIALLDQALPAVDSESAIRLRKWLVQVHRQWADDEHKRGEPAAAIRVLSALWKRTTGERDVQDAVAYFAQERLAEAEHSGGPDAAATLLAKLRAEFSGLEYLDEAGKLCARRALEKVLTAGKFEDAIAAVDRYRPLLSGDAAYHEIGGMVVDRWGRALVREKKWEQAVKAYGDGLKRFPTSELLQHNVVTAWDGWAHEAIQDKDWREAIRIYELALKALGDNAHLKHNLDYCRSQAK
jgi:tetratricopeptide (TPR) repeat protein